MAEDCKQAELQRNVFVNVTASSEVQDYRIFLQASSSTLSCERTSVQAGVNCGSQCKCENCQNQPADGPPEIRPSLTRIKIESRQVNLIVLNFESQQNASPSSGDVCF